MPNGAGAGIAGWLKNPMLIMHLELALSEDTSLRLISSTLCEALAQDQVGKFNWQTQLTSMHSRDQSKPHALMVGGLTVDPFMDISTLFNMYLIV